MVLALAALAASAASFPTGFGFGAGYGAGVRIGYDVIYPQIAPFAREVTGGIIDALRTVWSPGGKATDIADVAVTRPEVGRTDPRAGRPKVDLGEVVGDTANVPAVARGRQGTDLAAVTGEKRSINVKLNNIDSISGSTVFRGELSEAELHNLIEMNTKALNRANMPSRMLPRLRQNIAMLESAHRRVWHLRS